VKQIVSGKCEIRQEESLLVHTEEVILDSEYKSKTRSSAGSVLSAQ